MGFKSRDKPPSVIQAEAKVAMAEYRERNKPYEASKEQVIAWLSLRTNAESLPEHAKEGLTALWAEKPTLCECEYCPGHHVSEPMPTIYCTVCKKVIPTGHGCETYTHYGWDEEKGGFDFRCGRCHKNTQARERRAQKKKANLVKEERELAQRLSRQGLNRNQNGIPIKGKS
jgi:hypothetical protein